jgi:hypothetical protein
LKDAQCWPDISNAAAVEMCLEQQALHLAAFSLLLRFDLVKREL